MPQMLQFRAFLYDTILFKNVVVILPAVDKDHAVKILKEQFRTLKLQKIEIITEE